MDPSLIVLVTILREIPKYLVCRLNMLFMMQVIAAEGEHKASRSIPI